MFTNDENLAEKQKGILAAATELFAEKGYAATSTSEIAKKAGVAEGTIFRHYKSKKDLLLTIVSPTMIKVISPTIKNDINKILDDDFDHFKDFIQAMALNRIRFVRKNIPLLRVILQELPFHEELKKQMIEHIGKDIFEKFRNKVRHFQEKGQIRDLDPDTLIRIVAPSIFAYIVSRYVLVPEAEWEDEEKEIEKIVDIIANGIGK